MTDAAMRPGRDGGLPCAAGMKVVLISVHDAQAGRRTGFHFWMDVLASRGVEVRFITASASLVSRLRRRSHDLVPPFNTWLRLAPCASKFTWMPLFHPFRTGSALVDWLVWPLFRWYPALLPGRLLEEVRDADVFIVESGAGPMLVPTLARHAPLARFVYNKSDRTNVVRFHPGTVRAARDVLRHFSLIRLNSPGLADEFPPDAPVRYVPQAIDKAVFDAPRPNPYAGPRNAVSIGDMLFDARTIEVLAEHYPDWTFHVFGRHARLGMPYPNVREYGERDFGEIVAYLQHADIGLAPYADHAEAGYLSHSSLKLVQYTYCRLPIVAPGFAAVGRPHVLPYDPARHDTAIAAFAQAMACDRSRIDRSSLRSWEEVIDEILAAARTTPQTA